MAALATHDGTNTGTPINKKKIIPNPKHRSGRKKGDQSGHIRHIMELFEIEEITDKVVHKLDISVETCDIYGRNFIDTGTVISKDEFDAENNVIKRRHEYRIYECVGCGATVRLQIDKQMKEKNQYGSNVQALALPLMATRNVAINKVRMLLCSMTAGLMNPSEGFICKLYANIQNEKGS